MILLDTYKYPGYCRGSRYRTKSKKETVKCLLMRLTAKEGVGCATSQSKRTRDRCVGLPDQAFAQECYPPD